MRILKITLLIIWTLITFGLIIYSQMLKTEVLRKEAYYKEWREVSKGLSSSLDEYYENMVLLRNDTLNFVDIDSLFENSSFLKGYENVLKVQPN